MPERRHAQRAQRPHTGPALPPWQIAPPPPERPCAHVSPREAVYLLALHELARHSSEPTQVALARAMKVSPPTALQMVRRLRALGLLDAHRLALTPEGTSAALLLASRRRAAFVLTHELLGLDDESVEPEVERLAPSLSAALTRRLLAAHHTHH